MIKKENLALTGIIYASQTTMIIWNGKQKNG